jgi:hypothetical protein
MKKFIQHVFLLLLLVAVCSRCKHEPIPDRDCGEAQTIDEMMEWVYFKTGTYWIYEEQNTGILDTMVVYYDYNGVHPEGFRDFVVKIKSYLDGFTYEYWFNDSYSGDCGLKPGCTCRAVDCEKYKPGNYAGGGHVFAFALRIGNQVGQLYDLTGGTSKIVDKYEMDTIQEMAFGRTYDFRQDFSPQHDFVSSTYRIAHHVGIVKKTIPDLNENWELVEYHIIQ